MKTISYKKLWYRLIDQNMKKSDLRRATGISTSTLARLVADETVSLEVLLKICTVLNCNFSDIMDAVPPGTARKTEIIPLEEENLAEKYKEEK